MDDTKTPRPEPTEEPGEQAAPPILPDGFPPELGYADDVELRTHAEILERAIAGSPTAKAELRYYAVVYRQAIVEALLWRAMVRKSEQSGSGDPQDPAGSVIEEAAKTGAVPAATDSAAGD